MVRYHQINNKQIAFTAEEEAAQDAQEKAWTDNQLNRDLQELRKTRNALLAETDWWGASDNTMTADQTKYRKDLRDLPAGKDTVEKCENATWPTKP